MDIVEVLRLRRLTYFGHCTRMHGSQSHPLLCAHYTDGVRSRGRPRKWLNNVKTVTLQLTLPDADWPKTELFGGHWFINLMELELPQRADQPSSSPIGLKANWHFNYSPVVETRPIHLGRNKMKQANFKEFYTWLLRYWWVEYLHPIYTHLHSEILPFVTNLWRVYVWLWLPWILLKYVHIIGYKKAFDCTEDCGRS